MNTLPADAEMETKGLAPWVIEAAKLPVAFAQVREDPRLDAEVLAATQPGASIVMVASGGETAIHLARKNLGKMTLVDMNPAQLAMCQLKFALAHAFSPKDACAILGHTAMPEEERSYHLASLSSRTHSAFSAIGPAERIMTLGPAQSGRYEYLFAALRREIATGTSLEEAIRSVMTLANLVALFGEEATRNPAMPFHAHFIERFHLAQHASNATQNPFLNELLTGSFAAGPAYDWLLEAQPPTISPSYVCGRMTDVLASMPESSADMVHLSNLLDWLSPASAAACLSAATRSLRPGGKIIVRQLNSTIDIPSIPCGIRWDESWGSSLQSRDRSFFYPAIYVGERA